MGPAASADAGRPAVSIPYDFENSGCRGAGHTARPQPAQGEEASIMEKKRLYKSRGQRMVAGVCGGLAEYFALDVTWVRLGVVALCLIYGSGFLVYLLAALILPEPPAERAPSDGAPVVSVPGRAVKEVTITPAYAGPTSGGREAQNAAPAAEGSFAAQNAQDTATAQDGQNTADAQDEQNAAMQDAADEMPAAEVQALDIRLGGVKVALVPGEEWSLQTQDVQGCRAVVADGVWRISREGSFLSLPGGKVTVTFPRGQQLRGLWLNIGAGGLVGSGLNCQRAEIEAGAGGIELDDLAVAGPCHIKVGMGSAVVRGQLQTGAVIDCGMGSIKCRLERPADYGYKVDCGVGSVVIDGHAHAGLASNAAVNQTAAVQYSVECGMGSVDIGFTD